MSRTSARRVVLLCDLSLHTRATAAALLRTEVNLVGILIIAGLSFADLLRLRRKCNSVSKLVFKMTAHLAIRPWNGRKDVKLYNQLFPRAETEVAIVATDVRNGFYNCYSDPAAGKWLSNIHPDVLEVHSGYWASAKVRAAAGQGFARGGRPGDRGGYSSFLAILQGRLDQVGWSLFHIGGVVGKSDVLAEGIFEAKAGDSFLPLDWRVMKQMTSTQAEVVKCYDRNEPVAATPLSSTTDKTLYGFTLLGELLRYKFNNNGIK